VTATQPYASTLVEATETEPKSIFRLFLELVRFSHTIFAMPFALLALIWCMSVGYREQGFGSSAFEPLRWLAIVVCMVSGRNFAMTINRLADEQIDRRNPRTAARHLPAGLIKRESAWLFAAINALVFVAACLLFLPNRLPIVLAIPVLLFVAGYSFGKRWTTAVHFYLGASLMLAPICTWLAMRGEQVMANPLDILPAVLVGCMVLLWVSGFDLIYACQDADFDRSEGAHSIPAKIGVTKALQLAGLLHLQMIFPMILLPILCPQIGLSWLYFAGVAAIAAVLIYEHSIVKPNDLTRVNQAFFQANAIVGCLYLLVGGLDTWL
jgi:4-hydroxybenzoate polyprenyltransferase